MDSSTTTAAIVMILGLVSLPYPDQIIPIKYNNKAAATDWNVQMTTDCIHWKPAVEGVDYTIVPLSDTNTCDIRVSSSNNKQMFYRIELN